MPPTSDSFSDDDTNDDAEYNGGSDLCGPPARDQQVLQRSFQTRETSLDSSATDDGASDANATAAGYCYFVESRARSRLLVYQGYMFQLERTNKDGSKKYRCRSHGYPLRCPARITLGTNGAVVLRKLRGPVSHEHEDDRKELIEIRVKTKARAAIAENPTRSLQLIYNEVVGKLQEETADSHSKHELFAAIPVYHSIKSTLVRSRRLLIPKCPDSRENIQLTPAWTVCSKGKPFLLFNDGDEDKMLVFGTVEYLGLLCNAPQVFMDGTFYTSPRLFHQMYTIHAQVRNTMIPMVYALLPYKTEQTYIRLLRGIQDACQKHGFTFCPKVFQVDFERAAINAVRFLYKLSDIKGCYFHYTQAVWRHVRSNHLQEKYHSDMQVRALVKRLTALPLLKPCHVRQAWSKIRNAAPTHYAGVEELLAYFGNTWVSPGALFSPIQMWNHHGNYTTRTNNDLEGWHSSLKRFFAKSNPTLYDFITMIRAEQVKSELTLSFLYSGQIPRPQHRKQQTKNDRIANLTKHYLTQPDTAVDFLDRVGNLIKLNNSVGDLSNHQHQGDPGSSNGITSTAKSAAPVTLGRSGIACKSKRLVSDEPSGAKRKCLDENLGGRSKGNKKQKYCQLQNIEPHSLLCSEENSDGIFSDNL